MASGKKSVYIETTIPSYAAAKASRDIITAHRQAITRIFWDNERRKYDLYISDYVIDECRRGDSEAAKRRMDFIKDIAFIPENEAITRLADIYFSFLHIPEQAKTDCSHLAVCVDTKIDYLLSWNCTHLGQITYGKIYAYNQQHGFWTPELLTPESLMELEQEKMYALY